MCGKEGRIPAEGAPQRVQKRRRGREIQGNLARKKQRPPRTLQYDYAWGPMVIVGRWAVSYSRGTPVERARARKREGDRESERKRERERQCV